MPASHSENGRKEALGVEAMMENIHVLYPVPLNESLLGEGGKN